MGVVWCFFLSLFGREGEKEGEMDKTITGEKGREIALERAKEEKIYHGKDDLVKETICHVTARLDKDGDFILLFETKSHRYGVAVVVKDHRALGWKEFQCLRDALVVAERFVFFFFFFGFIFLFLFFFCFCFCLFTFIFLTSFKGEQKLII